MIFGTAAPKFVYNAGQEDEVSVMLNHVIITKDEPINDSVNHKSVVNGHREYILLGKHWIYEVRIYLFRYSDPLSKYREIKQYEGEDVVLYRHRDGGPFVSGSTPILFTLTSIVESYLETTDFKDLLILTFESKDYVELTTAETYHPSIQDIVMSNNN